MEREDMIGGTILEFRSRVFCGDEIIVEKDGKKYSLLVGSKPVLME